MRWKALPAVPSWLPHAVTATAFVVLFAEPIRTLWSDWWTNPDAGHGLLLAPVAGYLAWKRGLAPGARPAPGAGLAVLIGAVALRYGAGLAAELFTMRVSMLGAAVGMVVFHFGVRQVVHWWLPIILLGLSIPVPAVILNTVAFPLQLKASQIGAVLMHWRQVPVTLAGNVIVLPGQTLFVTEACSGLRSLTALLSLGVLVGGLWLRSVPGRIALVLAAIPVAIVLNGFRVFLTGFLVYFVNPELGKGFMHFTEGWAIFVVAFGILAVVTWLVSRLETAWSVRHA